MAPPRSRLSRTGPYVTEADGALDWYRIAIAGADFGYARASIGAGGEDTRFAANWRGMYAADMARGAVHIWSLCHLASDQATNFLETVPPDPAALPSAIDFAFRADCPARPGRDILLSELGRFLSAVEGRTGKAVILRLSPEFDAHYDVSATVERPLWMIRALRRPDYGARPPRLWEASPFARIDGATDALRWLGRAR